MSPLLGKTFTIAAKHPVFHSVCPLSYPAFTTSLQSAWVEMQHIMGPELIICRFHLISHSMFATLLPRVNSSCGDVPRVAYGIQSSGPDGRQCAGNLSEHHHLECLCCPEGTCLRLQWTQLRDAKKRAKFAGWTNGLTSVEFAHNLGLMCDVLSELKELSKQSGRKRRRKKTRWRKRRRRKRSRKCGNR